MESSPASLTATQVYLPESSAWDLGICNTRPPENKTAKCQLIRSCFALSLSLCFLLSVSPGKIRTLSLEVSSCPSLYQVSVGGGTALVSQYREMGLLSITSRTSPAKPGEDVVSPTPPGLLKLGGTEKGKRRRGEMFKTFFEHFWKVYFEVWMQTKSRLWLCIYLKEC